MNLERFDDFLYTIVKETGGLEGFFHTIFNFLFRRTDFFYESEPGDKMGFPPGMNIKIFMNVYEHYQKQQYKKYPQKSVEEYQKKLKIYQQKQNEEKKKQEELKQKQLEAQKQKQEEEMKKVEEEKKQIKDEKVEKKEEQIIVPEQSQKENKTLDINAYNGGVTEKYIWSQSIQDVTVQINIQKGTKAKDLQVEIKPNFLKVKLKNAAESIVEGELYDRIKTEESIWSLEDNEKLILTLEKGQENIWKTVIKGDQEIDATKVDNSKKLEEFDSETQGALRKIMYEQQRKQMGLPTTEEEKQQEILRKAWDAEGSPFRGQPFDPSKFNLSNSANSFNM